MSKVLIVDDSPEDREQIAFLLRQEDARVEITEAGSGDEALQCAGSTNFDCILLDLRLGIEDGLDVLKALRDLAPDVPHIVLTGEGNEKLANQAFIAGAAYYLTKSEIKMGTLNAAVQRVVQQSASRLDLIAKREQLERSNRLDAVGQLAAGVAHDFNNHLATLRSLLDILVKYPAGYDPKDDLQTSLKVIDECSGLTAKLLALSSQGNLAARPVEVTSILHDLHGLGKVTVSAEVQLDTRVPEADPLILADSRQLLNALLNLVANANDAITQSGRQGRIEVGAEIEPDVVRFYVEDDGPGMEADVLAKCCDPFFTTKPQGAGTGLGLAMVHTFSRENDSNLQISSSPKRGTKVQLSVPRTEGQLHAAPVDDAAMVPVAKGNPRILLVDDNELFARSIGRNLGFDGFDVDIAISAGAALQMIQEGIVYDAMITDIRMPDLNGIELVKLVHELQPNVKVLFLTGFADRASSHSEVLPGPVLQKPVPSAELAAAIEELLAPVAAEPVIEGDCR